MIIAAKGWVILLLGAASLAMPLMTGCASLPGGQTGSIESAAASAGATGTFRGRWWNYYQRGTLLLDRGNYAEAEEDLRTAFMTRSKDQLWPRTYGLHFLPEYFPKRELGITRYFQGDYDAAEEQILASLDEQHSARATFYLDQIRRKRIAAAGGDSTPPSVQLATRTEDIGSLDFVLSGTAQDNAFVSRIFVDGYPVLVKRSAPSVTFEHPVKLSAGQNSVSVRVVDIMGNESTEEFLLATDVDGPAVMLDDVLPTSTRLSGLAYDASGIDHIEILGQRLSADTADNTRVVIDLPLTGQTPESIAYRAVDRFGNATEGFVEAEAVETAALAAAARLPLLLPPMPYWLPAITQSMLLGATPTTQGDLRARLDGITDGQEFYLEEIVVLVDVKSRAELTSVELNGYAFDLPPGAKKFRQSRRVTLGLGENTLVLKATDAKGETLEASTTVSHAEPRLAGSGSRLAVAFLGLDPSQYGQVPPEVDEVAQRVMGDLPDLVDQNEDYLPRFTIVDRQLLPQVLLEKQLSQSEMADAKRALSENDVIPAEVLLWARIRVDAESMEVILNATSTETGTRLASNIQAVSDDADYLVEELAVSLVQEFPRATGEVTELSAEQFVANLGKLQGVKNAAKCIVFRPNAEGDARQLKPLFEGIIREVTDTSSIAATLRVDAEGAENAEMQVNDVVVLK